MKYIKDLLSKTDLNDKVINVLSTSINIILVILLCIAAYLFTTKIILKIIHIYTKKTKYNWDNIIYERKVFTKLARIVPAMVVYISAFLFPDFKIMIERASMAFIMLTIAVSVSALLDAINDIYRGYSVSKVRPIKGFLQIIKIIVYIVLCITLISSLMGKNPIYLLGGIGALTALFTLVFKDSILGFIAGILLTSNDMLRIGDWIEMPKYGADGDVLEITLITVKVQNWDKTIVTIPAYSLISDSFRNWRGMVDSGARRIKRSIYIDTKSIKFCTEEMIEKYKKIQLLKDYIINKEEEIRTYNTENNVDTSDLINGRHLTNIGTFRKYIELYLENNPKVHKGFIRTVRHLPPDEKGLPLEVYVFINDTRWVYYENAQADIFDHIFAVAGEFDLRIFQSPSGYDFNKEYFKQT